MFNWRKSLAFGMLYALESPILGELKLLRSIERKPPEEITKLQNRRLTALLHHAWENTDYYREILDDCGVVKDGKVNLDKFDSIPFLTKDIIRRKGELLK